MTLSLQGLTGPDGPPGKDGPAGEQVRVSWSSERCNMTQLKIPQIAQLSQTFRSPLPMLQLML